MKISELLQRIDYMVLQGNLSDEVTGICHDNRMIQEGMPLSVSQAHVLIHIRWQRNWQKRQHFLLLKSQLS